MSLQQSDCYGITSSTSSDNLAKDCKAFYEKRLQLTHSVQDKWQKQVHPESSLSNQIGRLRSELLSLAHLDNELFKNLLALNDKLEELKLQRGSGIKEPPILQEALSEETTDEYDDDDIDEEVEQEDEFHHMYSSLPPTQILERAAQVVDDQPSSSGGLDMMGGLKFMLRSRSFLLRPPFHKKNSAGRSRSRGSDSPFRTFDRIHENRVVENRQNCNPRSHSAERRTKKSALKLEAGSSATLTRGFHLPQSSRSLWQRVFVGSNHHGGPQSNGPESLPCSWGVVEDKSPPPTLKHIKQNSFDSGIHTSDSSEYSIKI